MLFFFAALKKRGKKEYFKPFVLICSFQDHLFQAFFTSFFFIIDDLRAHVIQKVRACLILRT